MLETLWSGFAVVASFAMCVAIVYFLVSGRDDRQREEEAREYFDQHGHWPDEAG